MKSILACLTSSCLCHTVQAAEAERCNDVFLLLPLNYNMQYLDLDMNYFEFGTLASGKKRPPPSSTPACAALRRTVAKTAALSAHQVGTPPAIKSLLWAQPTKDEWKLAVSWMCTSKKVSLVSHLLVCRQGCQRPFDMSRLSVADLMGAEAGDRDLGNNIPYIAFLPQGGKMNGTGQASIKLEV